MIILESYEEYKNQTQDVKSIYSNCYLMPQQIKQLITERRLELLQKDDNLFLLVEESGFYRMYYRISQDKKITKLELDKPIVIEYPYQGELSDKKKLELEIIAKLGFTLGRNSARMRMKAENVSMLECEKTINSNYQIFKAKKEDVENIEKLLWSTFDPLFAFLPTTDEIERKINEGYIFVIYRNLSIIGVLNMDIEKNTAWLRQLAVERNFRGKGIGKLLLTYYLKNFKTQVQEFMHWVDEDNKVAITMYEKEGFKLDGRKAREYILLPDNAR